MSEKKMSKRYYFHGDILEPEDADGLTGFYDARGDIFCDIANKPQPSAEDLCRFWEAEAMNKRFVKVSDHPVEGYQWHRPQFAKNIFEEELHALSRAKAAIKKLRPGHIGETFTAIFVKE